MDELDEERLKQERLTRLWEGRERANKLRAEGLLPPRRKPARPDPTDPEGTRAETRADNEAYQAAQAELRGGRGKFADDAEFQAAVATQVKAQLESLLPTIMAMAPAATQSTGASTEETLSKLAMLIAELTSQGGGSGPKPIPPDILLARKNAYDRMIGLIKKEQRATERDPRHEPPTFHLTSKIVARIDDAGDQVIEPLWRGTDNRTYPTELGWLGIPNLAMEPINESARRIMEAFRESIGNVAQTAFKADEREPEPNAGIETEFGVTEGGRLVTGAGVQQRKADVGRVDRVSVAMITGKPDLSPVGPGYQQGQGVIRNNGASLRHQLGMAPTKQVRVLGSIAPPAVQNG